MTTSTLVKGAKYAKVVLTVLAAGLSWASWYVLVHPQAATVADVVWAAWGPWLLAFGAVSGVEVGAIGYRDGKSGGLTSGRVLAAIEAGTVAAPVMGEDP